LSSVKLLDAVWRHARYDLVKRCGVTGGSSVGEMALAEEQAVEVAQE